MLGAALLGHIYFGGSMKNMLAFLAGVSVVVVGAWIGGFDFDQRGEQALAIYIGSVFSGLIGVWFWWGWHNVFLA